MSIQRHLPHLIVRRAVPHPQGTLKLDIRALVQRLLEPYLRGGEGVAALFDCPHCRSPNIYQVTYQGKKAGTTLDVASDQRAITEHAKVGAKGKLQHLKKCHAIRIPLVGQDEPRHRPPPSQPPPQTLWGCNLCQQV